MHTLARGLALATVCSIVSPAAFAQAGSAPALERFMRIRTPGAASILPDGQMLVRDWPDGVWQLYRVTPAKDAPRDEAFAPGKAATTKLTSFTDGLAGYSLSPDGTKVVLSHSAGGNENTQLSLLDPLAGPGAGITPLVDNPKVQASVNQWLKNSGGFIYSANDESPSDFYLYRYDFAPGGSGKATKILAKEGSWSCDDITADGARLLVTHYISASDSRCYELDLKSGALTNHTIAPKDGTANCNFVGYLPGEASVLLTSDLNNGVVQLFRKDLSTGGVSQPLPDLAKYELDGAGTNVEGDLLAVTANEDGYGVVRVYSLPDFSPLPMPEMEKGVVGAGSFRGRTLVWGLSNARKPGPSFATTWPPAGAKHVVPQTTRQITFADTQGLDLSTFPLPELVKYKAADGLEVPAFVYFPQGYTKGKGPIPFIVNYHGGPEGQSRPGFNATLQFLLSQGFGVMMPNVRGSTGYGREFQMMDNYKGRWKSVQDGVDAAEWLVAGGYAAPGKIATYGGSYGGFMSVACLVEDQERVDAKKREQRLFGAGVNVVGIVNLKTFLEKTAGYRRKLREVEYGPLSDPEFLASVSSIHKTDKLRVPMFIAHGFNDPRVPVEEAMQVAVALKDKGVPVQLFVAPDEGHGFAKLDNRLLFTSRMADFFRSTIAK